MSLNVVYIDDETDLCELFEMLHGDKFNITTFNDYNKGVEIINSNDVDIVFIDYRIPCMNGIECREKMKKDIPTYLVTGELNLEIPDDFAGFIEKPIKHENIKEIIKSYRLKDAS